MNPHNPASRTGASKSGLALTMLLLVGACGQSGPEAPSLENTSNAHARGPQGSTTASENSDTQTADAELTKYVGKHPSEEVEGTRFIDEPSVRAAVAATVPDETVRNFVFNYNGPDAPIVAKDGRILAWGCEAHNCGYHNWSISIMPDGKSAEVCFYHNDDVPDGTSTWYLPDRKTERRPGNCPSE